MKLRHLLIHAASLLSAFALQADTSVPFFTPAGGSLTIRDWTYTWQSASEDAGTGMRYDSYSVDVDDGLGNITTYSVTVQGRIGHAALSIVSGSDPAGASIDGFLMSGLTSGAVTWSGYSDNQSSWYHDFNDGPIWSGEYIDGTEWFQTNGANTYSVDLTVTPPVLRGAYTRTYNSDAYGWGSSVSIQKEMANPYARISGAMTGYFWNGYWIDGSTETSGNSGVTTVSFFGSTYSFVHGTQHTIHSWNGTTVVAAVSIAADYYEGEDGNATISRSGASSAWTISAWHGYGGSMSGIVSASGAITWNPRSAPLLASGQLALTPSAAAAVILLNWSPASSTVDHSNGIVTDVYAAASGETVTLSGVPKDYWGGTSPVAVALSGGSVGGTPVTGSLWALSGFEVGPGRVLEDASPISGASPFFTAGTFWLNRVRFDFHRAFSGHGGIRKDIYRSTAGGSVSILGFGDQNPKAVWVSTGPSGGTFGYDDGSGNMVWEFNVSGCTFTTEAPPDPAPAYWVDGVLYKPETGSSPSVYLPPAGNDNDREIRITPEGSTDFTLTLWDQQAGASLAQGTWYLQNGLFALITPFATYVPAYAADATGDPYIPTQDPALNLPPALETVSGIPTSTNGLLSFIGTFPDVSGSGADMAYYAAAGCSSLVKIALNSTVGASTRGVEVVNCADGSRKVGIYHEDRRLFQASAAIGQTGSLPMPLYAVHDSSQSHVLWNLPRPGDSSDDRPDTFIVRGEVWRFSHFDGDDAIYLGYLDGQTLRVGLLSTDGRNQREVTLTQPDGSNSRGLLDIRGSARLRNGVVVFSGNYEGLRITPTGVETDNLHTIAADLDLTGNVISFGSLWDDVGMAGAAFQFLDTPGVGAAPSTASLHTSLSRNQSEWYWWKAGPTAATAPEKVMVLDKDHQLKLYPKTGGNGTSAILLNPDGPSSLPHGLRVLPRGDLPMDFTNGPQP
jgi:hypothetical protein